jgi:hypothetical protein
MPFCSIPVNVAPFLGLTFTLFSLYCYPPLNIMQISLIILNAINIIHIYIYTVCILVNAKYILYVFPHIPQLFGYASIPINPNFSM